jgi:ElaA protein
VTGQPPDTTVEDEPQDEVRSAAFTELDALTAYGLWALRSEVFVVEQDCPYLDLDGRDLEPGTRHLWVEREGVPVATLRVLDDPGHDAGHDSGAGRGALRIGRVATAAAWRGRGFAARLVTAVLEANAADGAGERDVVLDAQSHLVDWYAAFGFEPSGRGFVEDGIPHTPMRRSAGGAKDSLTRS